MSALRAAVAIALGALPAPLAAQLGELRMGSLASYVGADAYQAGVGVAVGYAPARLAYMGVRWTYNFGGTTTAVDATGSYDVTDRAQLFGADLGLEFPVGTMELVVGGTLGVTWFTQHSEPSAATGSVEKASGTGFVAAPLVMLHVRIGSVMLVPQASWYFAGEPDFRWPVDHSGPAVSLGIMVPIETDRIRY